MKKCDIRRQSRTQFCMFKLPMISEQWINIYFDLNVAFLSGKISPVISSKLHVT